GLLEKPLASARFGVIRCRPRRRGVAMAGQAGFFEAEERLGALSAAGDPLERLRAVVDFEAFRTELEAALPRADRRRGGRPGRDRGADLRLQEPPRH
ncbi:hypothetical protein U1T56_24020, partial [Geminicoccaceae bacterium SYSU G07066]